MADVVLPGAFFNAWWGLYCGWPGGVTVSDKKTPNAWGVIANVIEPERVFRTGAKLWLLAGTQSDRCMWSGLSRSSRTVKKYAGLAHLCEFRVRWVPENKRDGSVWFVVDKAEAEERCRLLAERADVARAEHPNRRSMQEPVT